MTAKLNHTIVWCRNKRVSSKFLTDILGLSGATPFGPMLVVTLNNDVSLDFYERDSPISSQHYAFLIDETDFDQVYSRIRERGLKHWADPGQHRLNEINHQDGGRGMYFEDPDGHLLEVLTRPYGSGV